MTNAMNLIATHNGSHHADDVFAVAVLHSLFPEAEVVRTRDPEVIARADFAVDVGGEWEPSEGRFDHHQKGFIGSRLSAGVVYASAGLVWLAHGKEFVSTICPGISPDTALRIRSAVDESLVQYLDMTDTGAANEAPGFYGLSALIFAYNLTHAEEHVVQRMGRQTVEQKRLEQFMAACKMVQTLLTRIVLQYADEFACEAVVREAEKLDDGRILVLPESGLKWEPVVCKEMPDVLFVVYPDSTDNQHQVRVVPVELGSFVARRDLRKAWAGLRGAELAVVTGVQDAVFCHNARFIAGAGSKESALTLARLALLD